MSEPKRHGDKADDAEFTIPRELMHRVYNTLSYYANARSYEAERTGGVTAGCPRGPTPTPEDLVWPARWLLRTIEHDVIQRAAWDWIEKYQPPGPHCDTCKCCYSSAGQSHESD
jgi:hypothetical protein